MIKRIEHFQEVPHAASEAVSGPDQHCVELPAVGRGEHLIESRTLGLGAADSVTVFVDDFKATLFRKPAQVKSLGLRILIEGRDSGVQNRSLHLHNLPPTGNITPIQTVAYRSCKLDMQ